MIGASLGESRWRVRELALISLLVAPIVVNLLLSFCYWPPAAAGVRHYYGQLRVPSWVLHWYVGEGSAIWQIAAGAWVWLGRGKRGANRMLVGYLVVSLVYSLWLWTILEGLSISAIMSFVLCLSATAFVLISSHFLRAKRLLGVPLILWSIYALTLSIVFWWRHSGIKIYRIPF